jgi:kumamolisin
LEGSSRELLPGSRPAGPIDRSEIASLTIRVRSRQDTAELEETVREIYSLPLDRRTYLSRGVLAATYGAPARDFDALEHFAHKHGLRVSHRSVARRTIVLTGKLGDLLRVFHADLSLYHHARGNYRGRRGEIYIPHQFSESITGVFGYDTRRNHGSRAALAPSLEVGLPPTHFARHYNFPTHYKGRRLDGRGQCIGIIALGGGFDRKELRTYFNEIRVPHPAIVSVSVDGAANHPSKSGDDDIEVMMDVEIAGAVTPRAKLAVYFAPNTNTGTLHALSAAIHDSERNPSVIAMSWGSNETDLSARWIRAYHEVFLDAAALGITVCAVTGDHGTTGNSTCEEWDGEHHVYHPASDDLVLACGGTQMTRGKEVAWNDGLRLGQKVRDRSGKVVRNGGWATGGGISDIFKLPDYQKHASVPRSIFTGKRGRGVPDIAMSAENYFLRWHGKKRHPDLFNGGTSCVVPLMAGLIARLNQAKKKNVGYLNPFLYANASKGVAKDIRKGYNGIFRTIKGYRARRGWDACTGLGTPDGTAILNNL